MTNIVVGFCGEAGSGKTTTADALVGQYSKRYEPIGDDVLVWDHTALSAPLSEIVTIKRDIKGESEYDRQLYEIHKVIKQLLGDSPLYGAPPYDDMVKLVHAIQKVNLGSGEDHNRTCYQTIGDLILNHDELTFCKYAGIQIAGRNYLEYADWCNQLDTDIDATNITALRSKNPPTNISIVSDLRRVHEVNWLKNSFENSFLVRLKTPKEVRSERLILRDGRTISKKNSKHKSENIKAIDKNMIDYTISTEDMPPEDVATKKKKKKKKKKK